MLIQRHLLYKRSIGLNHLQKMLHHNNMHAFAMLVPEFMSLHGDDSIYSARTIDITTQHFSVPPITVTMKQNY